jgi:hypothetical protein
VSRLPDGLKPVPFKAEARWKKDSTALALVKTSQWKVGRIARAASSAA